MIEVRHQAEIPGAIFQAFRIARAGEPGPVGVVIPFPFYTEVWDYDQPAPPPYPVAVRRGGLSPGRSATCATAGARVGIYAGLGCVDAGPSLDRRRRDAPGAGGDLGQRQGVHPRRPSPGRRLGLRQAGHPRRREGVQGRRPRAGRRRPVQRGLDGQLRDPQPRHADPRRRQPAATSAGTSRRTSSVCADSRLFLDRLLADAAAIRRPPCPPLWEKIQRAPRRSTAARTPTVRITRGVDPMVFLTQLRCALGPDELIFVDVTASTHWASEAIEVQGPRRYFTPGRTTRAWAGRSPRRSAPSGSGPTGRWSAVTGDGCFLMSAMEMSTAARAGLPVKFFVLDDGAYHYMQMLQEPVYRRTTATEIARIDYAAFAQGVGLGYNQIACNADVVAGHRRAPGLARPDPDPRDRQLRRPRDPLAECAAVALHRQPPHRPEGPAWPRGSACAP